MSPLNITSSGVSLPRSQPPAISGNFLSRKHLFDLFESKAPGATLVIAPAGFGKTTLVAEWVKENERPTFWYTVDATDSIQDFQAHVIAAITVHFPNFFQTLISLNIINQMRLSNYYQLLLANYLESITLLSMGAVKKIQRFQLMGS